MRSARRRTEVLAQLALGLFGLWIVGPFLWALSVSLKSQGQYATDPFSWLPNPPTIDAYAEVLSLPFLHWLTNTMIVVVFSTVGQVVSCALVAYPLARMRFRFRDTVFLLAIATMMLPSEVLLIPQYLLFNALGWVDTFLPLVVPSYFALSGIFVFLLRQYYRRIPQELEEAVYLDGGGPFAAFRYLIVPLSIPAFAIVAILHVVGSYNDFFLPLIYLHSADHATLALGVARLAPDLSGGTTNFSVPVAIAAAILFVVPLILLYAFTHRAVTQAVEVGIGLKA